MSNFDLIEIPPLAQLVTDDEVEALRKKQEHAAKKMGSKWLLHTDNSVQKKTGEK